MAIITQDGNYTVKLYNMNGSVISDNYKLSQIIADLIASGYDCNALTLHQYSSYGYGSLMAFKVTETGLYYVGDNDLKSGLGSNATLFQKDNITFNQHYYTYTDGSPVDRGVISLGTQTINGLEYYYDYDGNVANEPIIYVDSSISLVVNDMLSPSGGAGSGYIGNSLLSNKKMVGYNVHTSSEESTKTESVNEASESPVSGKPKIGNGYARIKLIGELPDELVLYDNGTVLSNFIDIDNPDVSETSVNAYYQKEGQYLKLYCHTVSAGNRLLIVKFPLINCSTYTKVKIDYELYIKQTGAYTSASVMIGESDTEELAGKGFCSENYSIYKYNHWCIGDPDTYHSAIDDSDINMSFTNQNEDLSQYLYVRIRATNERSETTMQIKKITLLR